LYNCRLAIKDELKALVDVKYAPFDGFALPINLRIYNFGRSLRSANPAFN
jgi:hypothetical protein